jgi:putative transposase
MLGRMPRNPRSVEAGLVYHVLNRGNGRMRLFHKDEDFAAFEKVLGEGLERYPVDLISYCLMGNHWHLIVRPREDRSLSNLMRWVGVTHVRRHHEHYHNRGGGHLYQGRFKSFPIQEDGHFLRVCRYVEANALRAGLVERAEAWRWGAAAARSLRLPSGKIQRGKLQQPLRLAAWPVERPARWTAIINQPAAKDDLEAIRNSLARGQPFGDCEWVERTAKRLGLMPSPRTRGRPKKNAEVKLNEENE